MIIQELLQFLSFTLLLSATTSLRIEKELEETSHLRRRLWTYASDTQSLRFVSFGTSVTWGSGVDDRNTQTYIKILSPDGVNLGMRASDPSYPSICTQSMIGDDAIYDVIIIEYERRYNRGLEHLVSRLRQRFPDALIIVTDIWTYMNVSVKNEKGKTQPLRMWLKDNGFDKNTPEAQAFIAGANDVSFTFDDWKLMPRKEYMNNLNEKYGAFIYSWAHDGPVRGLITRHLTLYAEDFVHLSNIGHKFVAQAIGRIIEVEGTKRSENVGTWGEGDVCQSWLTKRKVRGEVEYDGEFKQFDDRQGGKYSIEFSSEGLMTINNPFDGERELALTYMTTGPAPSIYPKTLIEFLKSDQSITIDPTDRFYDYPVHVQSTKVVGVMKPGYNTIRITPQESDKHPFRIVGYSITNESSKISAMYRKPDVLVKA